MSPSCTLGKLRMKSTSAIAKFTSPELLDTIPSFCNNIMLPSCTIPYVTCRSAEGLSQVCHRSVQSYSRPIWRKTEVCKSAYCLWQTSHENDFFFDCVLPFILFAASLLQTFRDFWWLCNKDLLLCLHLICSRRCADNHPHETCGAVQRHKIASK